MGKPRLRAHILRRFLGLWQDRGTSPKLSYLNIAIFILKSSPKCCSPYNDHSERIYWDQQNLWDIFCSPRITYSFSELPSIWNTVPALPFFSANWVFCWHQKVEIRKVSRVPVQAQRTVKWYATCFLFIYLFKSVGFFFICLIGKNKGKKE